MSEVFRELFTKIPHFIRAATLWDALEILLVAFLVFRLMKFIHNTSVERVLKGILILLALMPFSEWLNLNVINFILRNTMQIGGCHPHRVPARAAPDTRERRRYRSAADLRTRGTDTDTRVMIREIVDACASMSWTSAR